MSNTNCPRCEEQYEEQLLDYEEQINTISDEENMCASCAIDEAENSPQPCMFACEPCRDGRNFACKNI